MLASTLTEAELRGTAFTSYTNPAGPSSHVAFYFLATQHIWILVATLPKVAEENDPGGGR
jgi:hypothetical protein